MKPSYQAVNFVCPVCGVQPQESCQLLTGAPRNNSHVERWDIAKDHHHGLTDDKPTVQLVVNVTQF
jgi:hypothetical protein